MADMEFMLSTDLRPVYNTIIGSNIDAVEAALAEIVKPYETMLVTEEGYRSAKSDLARIRAVKAKIDDVRKSVKAQWNKPLKEFEERVKQAIAAADAAESNLNSQIKEIEQRRRDERMAELEAFWEEKAGAEIADMVAFERIANPKWGNATYDKETAMGEISQQIAAIKTGMAAIRAMEPQFKAALLTKFKENWRLDEVLDLHERLKQAEEQERRRAARLEAERAEREAAYRRRLTEQEATPHSSASQTPSPQEEGLTGDRKDGGTDEERIATVPSEPRNDRTEQEAEPVLVCDFRVWGTRAQLVALRQYMKDNGIKIGRIPEAEE